MLAPHTRRGFELNLIDNNMALQESLYQLRSETQEAFDEAKALELKWKDLEREQREVYQVRLIFFMPSSSSIFDVTIVVTRGV